MADYNAHENKLIIKLVYYGPAQSGKTTNLSCLYNLLAPQYRGEMMSLDTQNDRTLFFDLLPLGFTAPSGLLIKIKIFTVPGQVMHDSTRKAVLSRADGVVFVADSQITQGVNNAESFQNLEDNAHRVGLDFASLPLVIQFNKRDLPNIFDERDLLTKWGETPWTTLFSSALMGRGVIETFRHLLQVVYESLELRHQLVARHGLDGENFISGVIGDFQRPDVLA